MSQFKLLLFKKNDIGKDLGNGKISLPNWTNTSSSIDLSKIVPSSRILLDQNSKSFLNGIENGDVIFLVTTKNHDSSWVNLSNSNSVLPTTDSFAQKYVVSNLRELSTSSSNLSLPVFNTNFIGINGDVRIVQSGDITDKTLAAPIATKEEILSNPNIKLDAFLVSSLIDPSSDLGKMIPNGPQDKPFLPYFFADGLSSNKIPSIDQMDSSKFESEVKAGTAPWIQRIDPFKAYQSLPIHSGDYVVLVVSSSDLSKPISENFNHYYKVIKVPTLLKSTPFIQTPTNESTIFAGVNKNAFFSHNIIFDKDSVDFTLKIESLNNADANNNKTYTFDHIPTEAEYSKIENGDTITITAKPKVGYWWGDPSKLNDVFADSVEFSKKITVSGLSATNTLIDYKPISISTSDFSITGSNGAALIKIEGTSQNSIFTPHNSSFTSSDYNLTFNLKRDGKIIETTDDFLNKNFFANARNNDEISITYSAKSPNVWRNAPNSQKSFETNSIKIDNKLAKNIFTDALLPQNLITRIDGTEDYAKFIAYSVPSDIGTVKYELFDAQGNSKGVVSPDTWYDSSKVDFKIGDELRATLLPNHANNYWYDWNKNSQPDTDTYTYSTKVSLPNFVDYNPVVSKLTQLINSQSTFDSVFTNRKGVLNGQGILDVNVDELEKVFGAELQKIKQDFDIQILLKVNNSNVENNNITLYDSTSFSGIKSINIPLLNLDSQSDANIQFNITSKIQNSTFDKRGSILKHATATDVVKFSNTNVKLWTLFGLKNILATSDISFTQVIDSSPQGWNVQMPTTFEHEYKDETEAKRVFAILSKMIDDGAKLLISSANRSFEYSKNTKEFELEQHDNKISITFDPSKVNNETFELGIEYKIVLNNQSSDVLLYNDEEIVSVNGQDTTVKKVEELLPTDTVTYVTQIESKPFVINGRYIQTSISTGNQILLQPNGISGQGKLDLTKMGIPTTKPAEFTIKIVVQRNGITFKTYDDVDSSVLVDGLFVEDKIIVTAEIRTAEIGKYRFPDGTTNAQISSRTLTTNDLDVIINIPQKPTLQQIKLLGVNNAGRVTNMAAFAIPGATQQYFVVKNGTTAKVEVTTFEKLSNGDKIFVVYKANDGSLFIGGSKTHEISYDVSALGVAVETPTLSNDFIHFIAENGKLTTRIDWDKMFRTNYDFTHIRANIQIFNQNHNKVLLVDPNDPNNQNYLQNVDLSDVFNPNSTLSKQIHDLPISENYYFKIEVVTIPGFEFENYQGTKVSLESHAVSTKIEKNSIDISKFFTFDSFNFTKDISGYASLDENQVMLADLLKSDILVEFVVKDFNGNIKSTLTDTLPTNLTNGDVVSVKITPKTPQMNEIVYNGNRMPFFTKQWLVENLREVINKPSFNNNSLQFAKINGQGRIVLEDFGDAGHSTNYVFEYFVKRQNTSVFESVMQNVSDLTNGDVIKVKISAPNGYAFVENNSEVSSYESQEYVVSNLLISKYMVTIPKDLIISFDQNTGEFSPSNFDNSTFENDKELVVEYDVNGVLYNKWSQIPRSEFFNGLNIDVKIKGAHSDVIFAGDLSEISQSFSVGINVIEVPNLDQLNQMPFEILSDSSFRFRSELLPVLPVGAKYVYSVENAGAVHNVSDISIPLKSDSILNVSIVPSSDGIGIILNQDLGKGVLKFATPSTGNVSSNNLIDFTFPNKLFFKGNDGVGTIDTSIKDAQKMFATNDVSFLFRVTSVSGEKRVVLSIDQLNLSNGDKIEIVVWSSNNKVFSNGQNTISKTYDVENLRVPSLEKTKTLVTYLTVALAGSLIVGLSVVSLFKMKKIFRKKK